VLVSKGHRRARADALNYTVRAAQGALATCEPLMGPSRGHLGATAAVSGVISSTMPPMSDARELALSGEIAHLIALGIPGPYGPFADGKEGVIGSSPMEGFVEVPCNDASSPPRGLRRQPSVKALGCYSGCGPGGEPPRRLHVSELKTPPHRQLIPTGTPGSTAAAAAMSPSPTAAVSGSRARTTRRPRPAARAIGAQPPTSRRAARASRTTPSAG
jgi:hypothetical protein